jgi:hypothetical protein
MPQKKIKSDDLLRFLLTPGQQTFPKPLPPSSRAADTSQPKSGPDGDITSIPAPPDRPTRSGGDPLLEQAQAIFAELVARRMESLSVYQPQNLQAAFHACKARHRLALGSNRSGKTLTAAVEVARAATGQDPHKKFPERDGVIFVVGKNWDHNGDVLYKKLCRAGAFKIIPRPTHKRMADVQAKRSVRLAASPRGQAGAATDTA